MWYQASLFFCFGLEISVNSGPRSHSGAAALSLIIHFVPIVEFNFRLQPASRV